MTDTSDDDWWRDLVYSPDLAQDRRRADWAARQVESGESRQVSFADGGWLLVEIDDPRTDDEIRAERDA